MTWVRVLLLVQLALAALVAKARAQSPSYTFDDGLVPAGTIVRGNNPRLGVTNAGGLGNSGMLILTVPASGETYGQWVIPDLADGKPITNLVLTFNLFIGGGSGGNAAVRFGPAGGNGMLFHWGPGLRDQYSGSASSFGQGLDVTFRLYNSGVNTAGINVFYGGTNLPGNNVPVAKNGYVDYYVGGVTNFVSNSWVRLSVVVTNTGLGTNAILNLVCSNSWDGLRHVFSDLVITNFVRCLTNNTLAFTATDGAGAHQHCFLDEVDFTVNGRRILGPVPVGPVAFTQQPVNQTVPENARATFTVAVTGAPPFYYQWRSNGVPIVGATSPSYTTPPAVYAIMNGTAYSVVVSNEFSWTVSSNAILTVLQAPVHIVTQPEDQITPANWTATFAVGLDPASTGPISYQWWQIIGSTTNAIVGATNAAYTTPALTAADSGKRFFVVVSNPLNTVTSAVATLTVVEHPVAIIAQPLDQSVVEGGSATFSVLADPTSTKPVTYQWWQLTDGVASPIPGETNRSYTVRAVSLADSGKQFYAVVSGPLNTVTSAPARLTVLSLPQFAPPTLAPDKSTLTLTWTNPDPGKSYSALIGAENLAGPWRRIGSVTNSPLTIPVDQNQPSLFFRLRQFVTPYAGPDYRPYVNVVQNANGLNGIRRTALLRYPCGRIGLWSIDAGEFADCVTRSLRLYPCLDTVAVRDKTNDWRNTITGDPSLVRITYRSDVAAGGSAVDLTVTPHVSVYRFDLADAANYKAVVMMANDLQIGNLNWTSNAFAVVDSQTVQVTLGKTNSLRRVFCYVRFNVPCIGWGTIDSGSVNEGAAFIVGRHIGGYFKFGTATTNVIAAVTISHTSMAKAQEFFEKEFCGMDFDDAVWNLKNAWISKLGKIEAQGPTLAMQQLYTALYTLYVNIIDASDNPYYSSYKPILTLASSDYWQYMGGYLRCDWDNARVGYALLTLIDPGVATHLLNTYQAQYDDDLAQGRNGGIPTIWCNWDPFSASGFSVNIYLPNRAVQAMLHGLTGIDFARLKNSITNHIQRRYMPGFFTYGYIPADVGYDNPGSRTLEYCPHMRGIATLGGLLGDMTTFNCYYPHRTNYLNLFDQANQQFRSKNSDGTWAALGSGFFEGNGVSYGFMVPHDPYGVLALYGPSNAVYRIDNYMRTQADLNDYQLIYEWLPIFADRADVNQALVRTVHVPKFNHLNMTEGFWPGSMGCYYSGNAGPLACCILGLYWLPTSGATWMISTPSLDSYVIHGRTDLTVQTVGNAPSNNYVWAITLDGVPYMAQQISGMTLVSTNHTITLWLTNRPSKIGTLYLSSADGEVVSATGDGSSWLEFYIDPITPTCAAQVYSAVASATVTLNGVPFNSWIYEPTTKLLRLFKLTKGLYRVTVSGGP